MIDLGQTYLTTQLIAYIGNKRRLIPLIHEAISNLALPSDRAPRFFDAFAGSGVVSRYAKAAGFNVCSNDWEQYAAIINTAHVGINEVDIETIFGSSAQLQTLLDYLNHLPSPADTDQYIARYYGPASEAIERADYRTERLFYTRQNALKIDAIRNEIDRLYEVDSSTDAAVRARTLLLALLLYEAATHTNTSGVFKACHKGFGGHGGDALKRILAPVELRYPVLIDSPETCQVCCGDTNVLLREGGLGNFDIVYIDPPYNQHQYGSNYHMLNTIAAWDRLAVPTELNAMGELKDKGGIRKDWTRTRSSYCYAGKATEAFRELIHNIDARYILISYSTDGIIPFDDLRDICSEKGSISLVSSDYVKFRGGRQSNLRLTHNIEFLIVIDTAIASKPSSRASIDKLLARRKLLLKFKSAYVASRLREHFCIDEVNESLSCQIDGYQVVIGTVALFELKLPEEIETWSFDQLEEISQKLDACVCRTKDDELNEILRIVTAKHPAAARILRSLPVRIKKLANPKYRDKFDYWLQTYRALAEVYPEVQAILTALTAIERVAARRLNRDSL
jgi:adenine-specific DNA-methyltransferase